MRFADTNRISDDCKRVACALCREKPRHLVADLKRDITGFLGFARDDGEEDVKGRN